MNNSSYKTPVQRLEDIQSELRTLRFLNDTIADCMEEATMRTRADIVKHEDLIVEQAEVRKRLETQLLNADILGVFERASELLAIEIAGRP